jgi:dienelactone hydrolase
MKGRMLVPNLNTPIKKSNRIRSINLFFCLPTLPELPTLPSWHVGSANSAFPEKGIFVTTFKTAVFIATLILFSLNPAFGNSAENSASDSTGASTRPSSQASEQTLLRSQLIKGVNNLLRGTTSETDPNADPLAIANKALKFKERYDAQLSKIPDRLAKISVRRVDFHTEEFSIPSLLEDTKNPKNNLIRGFIYRETLGGCNLNFPGAVILHHIDDDIEPEKDLAQLVSRANLSIVLVLYLPHYGPRKDGSNSFITNNFEDFQNNVLQALLDTRLAYEILKSIPKVDSKQISLFGISLGGIMTLISAGVDPVFERYGVLVAGGDLAHIMADRSKDNPDGETAKVLKDISWTANKARIQFGAFDSITWAGSVKNKYIKFMIARDDQFIDRKMSVDKLVRAYRANENQVEVKVHDGGHQPSIQAIGYWKMLTQIYHPVMVFFDSSYSEAARHCRY